MLVDPGIDVVAPFGCGSTETGFEMGALVKSAGTSPEKCSMLCRYNSAVITKHAIAAPM
jgi:hypothetical protein